MDPLTHALSGALLARATARNKTTSAPIQSPRLTKKNNSRVLLPLRLQITAGFVAAAFPDLDFALRLIDTMIYLNWHQGPTHSLLLLPLWALLLAQLFSHITHRLYHWKSFFLPACLGLAIHIGGDLITSYGLMLFAPLSTERYALPLAFVIDPWFTMIICTGLLVSWRYPKHRTASITALFCLCGYLLFLGNLREQAFSVAKNYADTHALSHQHISLLPQPLSPFHWKIIIRQDTDYHIARINLYYDDYPQQYESSNWLLFKMAAAYRPIMENHWQQYRQFGDDPTQAELIRKAWMHPAFEPFRTFSVFPVLERQEHSIKNTCYWFYDMRFKFPELPPSFRYGICNLDDGSGWQMRRHRGLFYID